MRQRTANQRTRSAASAAGRATRAEPPANIYNPLQIFGVARLAFWLPAETWSPASWPDKTGNLTVVQTDGAKQFTRSYGINGNATVLSDGVDDFMLGDMAALLLAGSRPFLLAVARYAPDDGVLFNYLLNVTRADASASIGFHVDFFSGRPMSAVFQTDTSFEYVKYRGPVADSRPHVFEAYMGPSTVDRFAIDAVTYNANSGVVGAPVHPGQALQQDMGRVVLANASGASVNTYGSAHYRDLICVRDQPTAAELTALRLWAAWRIAAV